jgi:hypothetical protein
MMWTERDERRIWVMRSSQLTIDSRAAAHGSAAWNDNSTSVEVWARFGDMEGDSSTVRCKVLDVSAGLDMAREVARVLATFDNEDLERRVGGS